MKLLKWELIGLILLSGFTAYAKDPLVKAIEIRGNKKIEKPAILQKVKTSIGSFLNKEVLREDIRSIFQLGFFDSVNASEDDFENGIKVIFDVKEKPVIASIEYQGLDALDKDDIKDQVQIKEYEVLDLQKLKATVEKLQSKYEEKGYYLADIRYEIVPDDARNESKIIFHIEENDKIQVKKINIIGAKKIAVEDLKSVMQTKEGGAFSWLSGSGAYREAVFERDVATMGFYYGTFGYVRARFGKPEVTVSPDKKYIYITFSVEEGEQYNVGKVDFAGDLLYSREELVTDSKLIPGEIFNTETLRRETLKYTDKYSDLGYAFANVVPQPMIHDDTRTVDLTYEVERGERVFIGKIVVTSNTRTKDKVVRRELSIHEGELFSGSKKRESRESVMRLGYFDSVEFHQTTSKTDPNVVDMEVRVKERSTGQLVIGAGYATGSVGFTAHAQLSQNNFLGNGQVASFSAEMRTGQKFYQFNLNFQEPYVGSTLWSLGGDLYQIRRDIYSFSSTPTFSETRTGAGIKLGHPIVDYTSLFLNYKFENAYVPSDTIIDQTLIPFESVNGYTSSATASVVFDKRDDRYDPRSGYYWSISNEYAGLGGDRKYNKVSANFKYFYPIFSDLIFRLNVVAGTVKSSDPSKPVPVTELYFLGGLGNLRGYKAGFVGPERVIGEGIAKDDPRLGEGARYKPGKEKTDTEPAVAEQPGLKGQKFVFGGHNQAFAQAELEFPILKEARLRGVFFFDAGNAWDDLSNLPEDRHTLYTDFGWGFRWFTPIGPLRFEFGYPIVSTGNGLKSGSPEFQFSIGQSF